MHFLDFDLRLERAEEKYKGRLLSSPAGQAATDFSLPFSNVETENFVLKNGRPRRGARHVVSAEMTAAKAFGGSLFKAIFEGELLGSWRSSFDEATRHECDLRLRLLLTNASELAEIFREHFYNPSLDRFLAISAETPFVRYLDLSEKLRPLEVKFPLKVLVMISSSHNHPQLDMEQEWTKLQQALADLVCYAIIALERLKEATLMALQRQLRHKQFPIFLPTFLKRLCTYYRKKSAISLNFCHELFRF